MADVVSPETRSRMMAGIKGSNTAPELALRKGLHGRGFRFRLGRRDLPGSPDLVFPRHNAVLFAHGCFWHRHECHLFKWPTSRPEFWRAKIDGNVLRDGMVEKGLLETGWRVGTVWECAMKGRARLPIEVVLDRCVAWLLSDVRLLEIAGNEARIPV
jgi:DNA mismatch endonuclease (patch repair protein)